MDGRPRIVGCVSIVKCTHHPTKQAFSTVGLGAEFNLNGEDEKNRKGDPSGDDETLKEKQAVLSMFW